MVVSIQNKNIFIKFYTHIKITIMMYFTPGGLENINYCKQVHPFELDPSMFPRRLDCTLSNLRLIRPSLITDAFAVSETVPLPISQLIESLLAALGTRLRIAQSFTFLRCPRSLPWIFLHVSMQES